MTNGFRLWLEKRKWVWLLSVIHIDCASVDQRSSVYIDMMLCFTSILKEAHLKLVRMNHTMIRFVNEHPFWLKIDCCLNIVQCCNGPCVCVNTSWRCALCSAKLGHSSPPRVDFGTVHCRPGHRDWLLFLPPCQSWTTEGEALQVVRCNGSGWFCMHGFDHLPNHAPQNYNCTFFPLLYKTSGAVNQNILTLIFNLCFSSECLMTDGFVGVFSV